MHGPPPAFLGRFEIVQPLGGGGFAETWLARDLREPANSPLVVLKRLRNGLLHRDPVFLESLLSEAEFGMRVHSPHVVRVLRVEDVEGEPTIVMEYVEGYGLDRLIRAAEHGMAQEAVAEIVRQLAEGLLAIHEVCDEDGTPLHLVHQDVKPANVIVSASGAVKLIDLGLTRPQRPDTPPLWVRQGTRGYRSPEQHRGDIRLTPASDLYNVGLIMYEALHGSPAFQPEALSAQAMLDKQKQMAIQIEVVAPRIASPGLDIILQRLLAFDVAARYHSAWDLARDIRHWQSSWHGDIDIEAYFRRLGGRANRLSEGGSQPGAIHWCDTQPGDRAAPGPGADSGQVSSSDLPSGSAMRAVHDVSFHHARY